MPRIETGDVLYQAATGIHPEHILMAYDSKTIIHAQNSGDFHKEANQQSKGGIMSEICDSKNIMVFRPPWSKSSNAEYFKGELQRVADAISLGAEYGIIRAVRLFAGSAEFGKSAQDRLMKYHQRYQANKGSPANFSTKGNEVVKHVTCSEAVILTYQLTFPLDAAPFFIRLDAAHAMPGSLRDWLRANGWAHIT